MSIWKKVLIGFGALIAISLAVSPFLPDEEETSTETEVVAEAPEAEPVAAPTPTPTTAPTATPEPTATPLPTPEPTAEPLSDEELAILVFRTLTNDLESGTSDNLSDADIVAFGANVCELAGFADTLEDFALLGLTAAEGSGMSNEDSAYVFGVLLSSFCPDEADRLGMG